MKAPISLPCYCYNLRRAAGAITDMYDDSLRSVGLNAAQYCLLVSLSLVEPVNTTHFASYVGLERSTLVRNIQVLQNNGWVEDQAKGRKHQFCLTESGRLLLEEAAPVWEKTQDNFIGYMGNEDATELMRLLYKIQNRRLQK